jgi:hypothetical protein
VRKVVLRGSSCVLPTRLGPRFERGSDAFGEVMRKEAQAAADGASHRTSRHLFLERWVILTDIDGAK